MAIVYRSEKKKIIRSQLNLIQKVLSVLHQAEDVLISGEHTASQLSYRELLLEETETEAEWHSQIQENSGFSEEKKAKEL